MVRASPAARAYNRARPEHIDGGATTLTTNDAARVLADPAHADAIASVLAERLRPYVTEGSTLVSPNTESIPMATLVATALGLPLAYLRLKAKAHGKQRQVEGVLPAGSAGLLLFDAVDDAATVREAAEIVERHGAVAGVVAAVQVTDSVALAAALKPAHLDLIALTSAERAAAPTSADERQHLKVRVARALLDIGAVTVNAAQPYRYTSGILSPIYTDNRLLISHPAAWDVVIDGFSSAVAAIAQAHGLDALAGAATAGLPHAARIAQRLRMPLLYVDLSQQDDAAGHPGALHGSLTPGARLIIIEDLVTTGKSVIEFADALTARQAVVSWCVAIFTYDVAGARATFAARGLTFEALCDIDTLLDVAVQDGNIADADRAAVHEWLGDRMGWSDRAEARLAATGPA